MTESEVLEIINLHAGNAIYSFSIYITLTFAYLTVAYFVGAKMSAFQVAVVSILYFFSGGGFALSGFTHTQSFVALVNQHPEFIHTSLWRLPWLALGIVMTVGGMLICFLFMRDVRNE